MATANKLQGINAYSFVPTMSRTRRIAHFLDWAAKHLPREVHQFNTIAKAVNGFGHLPRLDSKESALIQGVASAVRKVLLTDYKRGMVSVRGLGIRATVDDADIVIYDLPKKAERLQGAITSFASLTNVVNPANIPKTKEMQPFLQFTRQAKEAVGLLYSNNLLQKLLPPSTPKKEEPTSK
jgi:hypothetical protein